MKRFFVLAFLIVNIGEAFAQVKNTSYITLTGEKVLRLEAIIPVDQQTAWKYFTTDELLKKWIAPVAHIELKTGGYLITNYNDKKTLDDSSSIRLGVINYLERDLLTLKVKLNSTFPQKARDEDENLQEVIQFIDQGNGHTKIISSMVGWKTGPEWDQTYNFFQRGNEYTFQELLKLFR